MKFYIPDVRPVKAAATYKKILLMMKLTLVLMIAVLMEVSAASYAQKVTLSAKQITLREVFRQIRKQTGYNVLWDVDLLKDAKPVAMQVTDATVEEVLKKSFANQPFTYTIRENTIVVTRSPAPTVVAFPIKGRVTDNNGEPLIGVAVRLKNSKLGTATQADGSYTLNVPDENGVLIFSYLGYTPKEVPINGQAVINVKLEQTSSQLTEVVVAYGKQSTREIVGSVSKLSASDMKDQPTGTFAERLQGKLPGAQVAQTTGRPGQGMDLRIRGAASFTSNVRPLVVVDGQPMIGDPDNINNINPDEIESFTILKDAAATALYGSRAANGVIIITTKRGKAGATQIDFNSYYGTASMMRELIPPVMNATQLATYMKGFYEDKIKYEGYTGGIPAVYQNPEQYGEGTDWFSVLTRNAPVQNYSLAINTGNDKAAFSLVGGYFNQQGILLNLSLIHI